MPNRTPADREALMTKVRAAKTIAAASPNPESVEMAGFLAIFHPDLSPDSEAHRTLMAGAKERDTRRRRG